MAKQSEAKVTFKLEAEEFKRGMKELTNENTKLRKEFRLQQEQMKETASETEKLEARINYLGKEQEITRKKIELTSSQLEKAKQVFGENSSEVNKLSNELLDLQIKEQRTENSIQQARNALSKQGQEMQETGKDADKLGQKLQDLGEKANDVGDKLMSGVSAPLAAAGLGAGASANQFESAQGKIRAQLGLTAEKAAELEKVARSVWLNGFGEDMNEAAEAVGQLYTVVGDIPDKELQEITQGVLTLVEAFGFDITESVTGLNTVMTNFKVSGVEALDLLTYAAQNTTGVFRQDLSDALTELAPTLNGMGATGKQAFDLLIEASKSGMENFDALSSLTQSFTDNLLSGSEDVNEAFSNIGGNAQKTFEAFKKGNASAFDVLIATSQQLGVMDDRVKMNQLGAQLFGDTWTEAGADAIVSLGSVNGELENVEGATEEAGKALHDNFGDRAKKMWRDFQSELEPAGDALLDVAEDILPEVADAISDITQTFASLSPEAQETIIKFLGIAAAAGPVTKGVGGISTAVSTVSSWFNKAGEAAGTKAGFGATLLNLVSKAGPVGLAVTALGLLAGGIYAVAKASDENVENTLKSIDSRQKEIDSLDQTIKRFDELQGKNKLTADEMLRYMDIMSELKDAKSEEAIQKLSQEQQALLEKSGLTNDEMLEFLDLNGKIVEKSPATEEAISNQGNAYATTTDKVKELNDAERKRLEQDTYNKIRDGLDQQARNLEKQRELQSEINSLESEYNDHLNASIEINSQIQAKDLEIAGIRAKMATATGEEKTKLAEKLLLAQDELSLLEGQLAYHDSELDRLDKKIGKKQESLLETEKELSAFDNLLEKYAEMVLQEQGINFEKGKAIEAIQTQQTEIDTARAKLQEMFKNQQISRAEYEAQNAKLDEQQGKIDAAKAKLEAMNEVAGRTVYKTVNINTAPSIQEINRQLSSGIYKDVNIRTNLDGNYRRLADPTAKTLNIITSGGGHYVRAYAKGTDYHPGGPAILAEEGPELVRQGNELSIAPTIGLYDLKRGADVFTAEETEKILKGLMRLPAYATGAGIGGKLESYQNTGVNLATTLQNKLNAQFNITVVSQLDGREVARNQYRYIKEIDEFESNRWG